MNEESKQIINNEETVFEDNATIVPVVETELENEETAEPEKEPVNEEMPVMDKVPEDGTVSEPEAQPEAKAESNSKAVENIPKKKGAGKIIGIILAAVMVVGIAAGLVVWFTVLRPNGIYEDAQAALQAGDFNECERLLNSIPTHSGTPALRTELTYNRAKSYFDADMLDEASTLLGTILQYEKTAALRNDITYRRAVIALSKEDYVTARELMDSIPDYEDTKEVWSALNYNEALSLVETGDYEQAYELLTAIPDYKDAKAVARMLFYEAYAFKCLLDYQPSLKNPSSLRVTSLSFYGDDGVSYFVAEITGTNSYGGTVGSYLYYNMSDFEHYSISASDYADPEDYYDALVALLIDNVRQYHDPVGAFDVARMNRLLEAKVTFKIDLDFDTTVKEN